MRKLFFVCLYLVFVLSGPLVAMNPKLYREEGLEPTCHTPRGCGPSKFGKLDFDDPEGLKRSHSCEFRGCSGEEVSFDEKTTTFVGKKIADDLENHKFKHDDVINDLIENILNGEHGFIEKAITCILEKGDALEKISDECEVKDIWVACKYLLGKEKEYESVVKDDVVKKLLRVKITRWLISDTRRYRIDQAIFFVAKIVYLLRDLQKTRCFLWASWFECKKAQLFVSKIDRYLKVIEDRINGEIKNRKTALKEFSELSTSFKDLASKFSTICITQTAKYLNFSMSLRDNKRQ